ncbi:MAG TPA: lytic transglycosylase domain-containing protein [Terriglobales bacterium]|nr:lytic transglycosylase domain-containing protein [Terriglobales bacterium]
MTSCAACVMLLLVGVANAQPADHRIRELAGSWVVYYAGAYRVPVELVEAIIDEESGWNPFAVSSKGAAGIMQLMPATALRFGVRNRFRLDENIHGGVAYLAWLGQRFRGDLRLMTAAYYVGEYAISMRGLAYSSQDVQSYVKRVAARYRLRRLAAGKSRRRNRGEHEQDSTVGDRAAACCHPIPGATTKHRSAGSKPADGGPQDHKR